MMIGDKKDHKEDPPQHYPVISGPTDVKREMHIGFNPATGKFEVFNLLNRSKTELFQIITFFCAFV